MPKVTIIPQATLSSGQVEVTDQVANEADRFLAELTKHGQIGKNGNGNEMRVQFDSEDEAESWKKQAKVHYLRKHKLVFRQLPDTAAGIKKLAPNEHRYQLTPYVEKPAAKK